MESCHHIPHLLCAFLRESAQLILLEGHSDDTSSMTTPFQPVREESLFTRIAPTGVCTPQHGLSLTAWWMESPVYFWSDLPTRTDMFLGKDLLETFFAGPISKEHTVGTRKLITWLKEKLFFVTCSTVTPFIFGLLMPSASWKRWSAFPRCYTLMWSVSTFSRLPNKRT